MIVLRETVGDLLDRLGAPERTRAEAQTALRDFQEAPAWYIRLLAGMAAWWAASSFISCLGIAGAFESHQVVLFLGVTACVSGVVIRHTTRDIGGTFLPQLALATSIAGQSMTLIGAGLLTESLTATVLIGLVMEIGLLLTYPDALHRFLSTVSAGAMASVLVMQIDDHIPLHLLSAPLLLGAIAVWHREADIEVSAAAPLRAPVGFGMVTWVFASLIFALWSPQTQLHLSWLTVLGLTLVVGGLATLILREMDRTHPTTMGAVWVGIGALGLLTASTPGIIAALGTMLLAFHRRNPLLLGMSSLFLAGFLTFFYYDLDLTLWTKSGLLVGSGALMLLARLALPTVETEEVR